MATLRFSKITSINDKLIIVSNVDKYGDKIDNSSIIIRIDHIVAIQDPFILYLTNGMEITIGKHDNYSELMEKLVK